MTASERVGGAQSPGQTGLRLFAVAVVLAAIAGGLTLAVLLATGRAYQVDEVEHVHAAFNLRRGERLYADFWEGHNPLLYLPLYALVDPAVPEASLARARALALAALLATVATAAWCASRLGGWPAARLTAGLLLLSSTMLERGIEVRPDGWLALCTVLALASELSRHRELPRFCLEALCLSAAFLFTQKAVYVCLAFGLLWLAVAWRRRRAALVVLPFLVWLAPVAIAGLALWRQGSLAPYLEYNILDQFATLSGRAAHRASFGPWHSLGVEGRRNVLFWLAAPVGAVLALRGGGEAGHRRRFLGLLAVVSLLTLWANPFPFPYLLVTILPVLGVAAGTGLAAAGRRWGAGHPARAGLWAAACLLLAALTSTPRLIAKSVPANGYQLHVLREIQRITGPDDAVFDLAGLHARRDAYPIFVMTTPMMQRYLAGDFPRMIPYWRERELVAVIDNYRIHWLRDPEFSFLDERLIYFGSNIYVLGTELQRLAPGEELPFEALKQARFRFEGRGELLVDGGFFAAGILAKGWHRLTTRTGIEGGRLVLDVPPPQEMISPKVLYENFD